MLELQIEGNDKPLSEKREFFTVTDDKDGEVTNDVLRSVLGEYFDEEDALNDCAGGFLDNLQNAQEEDGRYKIQIPDDEVSDVVEALTETNWPEIEQTMGDFHRSVMERAEQESTA